MAVWPGALRRPRWGKRWGLARAKRSTPLRESTRERKATRMRARRPQRGTAGCGPGGRGIWDRGFAQGHAPSLLQEPHIGQVCLLLFLGSLLAGGVGALTGLGGGVILVPLLTLGFKVDLHYALGASLVSVIATSSGAASAYVREGYSNLRIGMFLEDGHQAPGALLGAHPVGFCPSWIATLLRHMVLLYSAFRGFQDRHKDEQPNLPRPLRIPWRCACGWRSAYPTPQGPRPYWVAPRAGRLPA